MIKFMLYLSLLLPMVGFSENAPILQTKTKLNELQNKINTLQQTLHVAHDKHKALHDELAKTEKNMLESSRKLHILEQSMQHSETKTKALEQQISVLTLQLNKEQQRLRMHIQARYKLGESQPIKWLFNQDDPHAINRVLTYHEYVLQSRQTLINQMNQTKASLKRNEDSLNQELQAQKNRQQQLNQHQLVYEQDKRYHTAILQTLQKDIQNKQQTLDDYKRDQANLSRILATLMLQQQRHKNHYTVFPLFQAQSKMAAPVRVEKNSIQNMNQGVIFFAPFGTPVKAVLPGRVVFTDWLKGYGLLLILDNGRGLMTLYAHNQSLFKKKGDTVTQGEQIASVGHSGTIKQNGLYFEIRRRGKAVPPLAWLS